MAEQESEISLTDSAVISGPGVPISTPVSTKEGASHDNFFINLGLTCYSVSSYLNICVNIQSPIILNLSKTHNIKDNPSLYYNKNKFSINNYTSKHYKIDITLKKYMIFTEINSFHVSTSQIRFKRLKKIFTIQILHYV